MEFSPSHWPPIKRWRVSAARREENSGQLIASLAALAAKLATARHGCSALGTLDRNQRSATLIAESRAIAIRCLTAGTVDGICISTRTSAGIFSGWNAVVTPSRSATATPPAMVMARAVMIVIVMMSTVTPSSVVAAQQHVK